MKKQLLTVIISVLVIGTVSCNSQNKTGAVKQANDIQKMVKENSPGYMPTGTEYYLKAKINGKDWVAEEIMASGRAGRIVGKMNGEGGESISLPFELRYTQTGSITDFKNHAVDIFMDDEVGIWGGTEGKMKFTSVGDNYAEGKFYITATSHSTDKKLIITEGTFRIPVTRQ